MIRSDRRKLFSDTYNFATIFNSRIFTMHVCLRKTCKLTSTQGIYKSKKKEMHNHISKKIYIGNVSEIAQHLQGG